MTALSSKYNKAWLYLLTWISERASLSGSRLSPGLISVDADAVPLSVSPHRLYSSSSSSSSTSSSSVKGGQPMSARRRPTRRSAQGRLRYEVSARNTQTTPSEGDERNRGLVFLPRFSESARRNWDAEGARGRPGASALVSITNTNAAPQRMPWSRASCKL